MNIAKDKVVSIEYELKSTDGEILDSSDENGVLSYLQGSGFLFPGLEKALEGKKTGDQLDRTFTAVEAYGEYDEALVFNAARSDFAEGVELFEGLEFEAEVEDEPRVCTIIAINGDEVTVDANHPLSGEDLQVRVKVTGVREATPEEIENGHVHDGDGHHHDHDEEGND